LPGVQDAKVNFGASKLPFGVQQPSKN